MKREGFSDAFAVMKVPDFRFFLGYRFFMTTAVLMQSVVVSWQLYDLTKNVLSLGLIGLTEVIPQVAIALFAGHYVDIWDRKRIIVNTSLLLLLGAAILLVYSLPQLNLFVLYHTVPIFITIFIVGLTRGILMPANTAIMGQLVSRDLYTNAATWNSANWHIAAVVGPAIGGLVYGFFGIVAAYSVVFVFYLISILLVLKIRTKTAAVVVNSEESIFTRINQGIKYVFNNQVILGSLSLDMFAVLFGGALAMLPVFASDVLKVGPQGLGILRASPALGAILMALILAVWPPVKRTGFYLFTCVTGFGICMIAFALSENFYLSLFILFMSGVFDNMSVVIRGTIIQIYTPDEMRGRVAAVNSIFVGSSNELGAFESGLAARIMGLVPSVIFGGAMTLAVVAASLPVFPKLRKMSLKADQSL